MPHTLKLQHDPTHSSACVVKKPKGGGVASTQLPGRGLKGLSRVSTGLRAHFAPTENGCMPPFMFSKTKQVSDKRQTAFDTTADEICHFRRRPSSPFDEANGPLETGPIAAVVRRVHGRLGESSAAEFPQQLGDAWHQLPTRLLLLPPVRDLAKTPAITARDCCPETREDSTGYTGATRVPRADL